jgi:hypothetical protein
MGVLRNFSRGEAKKLFLLLEGLRKFQGGGQKKFQDLFLSQIVKISTKFQELVPK